MSMNNPCTFSPCRRYRYTLEHHWDELMPRKRIMWIGLNPSTADERKLDNTLMRVKGYSTRWGYNCFVMTNLFAFRATEPDDMKREADPVGPDNDDVLIRLAQESGHIIACWGNHGVHRDRNRLVLDMLKLIAGKPLHCLTINADGSPHHPLYLPKELQPVPYVL